MLFILFDVKGFFLSKNSSLQAKQSIPHTTVPFYGDWVKKCEDFEHHLTSFFTRGSLAKNNTTVIRTHSTFLFPRLKIKLKDCHFDRVEVIEAESEAMLNTLTEHDFQDAFKKRQKLWERFICVEGTTSRMMVASRPNVSF
jgi:hypothetical protein